MADTVKDLYDEALKKQGDALDKAYSNGLGLYGGIRSAGDNAYQELDRQARIDKAMQDRVTASGDRAAGITAKAAPATISLRSANNLRNTLGKTERQHENYERNVDLALGKLQTQNNEDRIRYSAQNASDKAAAQVSQSNFDNEYNLKKNEQDFNEAYTLFMNRKIGPKGFKNMTGIAVKALPKLHNYSLIFKDTGLVASMSQNNNTTPVSNTQGSTQGDTNQTTSAATSSANKEQNALSYLSSNTKELIKRYGKEQYNFAVNYYTSKSTDSTLGSNSDSFKKLDEYIINSTNQDISYNDFYKGFNTFYSPALEELTRECNTYNGLKNTYLLSAIQKYFPDAAKQFQYTDSLEDKIRKAMGYVPASFGPEKIALLSQVNGEDKPFILKNNISGPLYSVGGIDKAYQSALRLSTGNTGIKSGRELLQQNTDTNSLAQAVYAIRNLSTDVICRLDDETLQKINVILSAGKGNTTVSEYIQDMTYVNAAKKDPELYGNTESASSQGWSSPLGTAGSNPTVQQAKNIADRVKGTLQTYQYINDTQNKIDDIEAKKKELKDKFPFSQSIEGDIRLLNDKENGLINDLHGYGALTTREAQQQLTDIEHEKKRAADKQTLVDQINSILSTKMNWQDIVNNMKEWIDASNAGQYTLKADEQKALDLYENAPAELFVNTPEEEKEEMESPESAFASGLMGGMTLNVGDAIARIKGDDQTQEASPEDIKKEVINGGTGGGGVYYLNGKYQTVTPEEQQALLSYYNPAWNLAGNVVGGLITLGQTGGAFSAGENPMLGSLLFKGLGTAIPFAFQGMNQAIGQGKDVGHVIIDTLTSAVSGEAAGSLSPIMESVFGNMLKGAPKILSVAVPKIAGAVGFTAPAALTNIASSAIFNGGVDWNKELGELPRDTLLALVLSGWDGEGKEEGELPDVNKEVVKEETYTNPETGERVVVQQGKSLAEVDPETAKFYDEATDKIKEAETKASEDITLNDTGFKGSEMPEDAPEQPGTAGIKTENQYKTLSPEELTNKVSEGIQNSIKANSEGVQKALTEGMTDLIKIENRIKADSKNINYQGIDIDASHNAYMDYISRKGSIETAATAMAEDIKAAFQTGELTGLEIVKLQSALTDIVGDADLAGEYIWQGIDKATANIGEGTGNIVNIEGETTEGEEPDIDSKIKIEDNKATTLANNRAIGRAFEQAQIEKFCEIADNVVEQVTVRTNKGTKIRVDAIGTNKQTGNIVIQEYKSSKTAPLTPNQNKGFPELQSNGGAVVGKGKGIYPRKAIIPKIKVDIIRPK